ncbi:MAG: hypothetical protein QM638_18515 [Nocardioides sp.]|uniref:hypothetical protein n=1 Tax=Nocardioides sp. TaxID=35761 RepID=UPI0039E5C2B5
MAQAPRLAGRPRWWAVGLPLFGVLVVALLVWRLHAGDEYVAPSPAHSSAGVADQAGATESLNRVVSGVAHHRAPTGAGEVATVLRNAAALHVTDFSLRYLSADSAVAADGSWTGAVAATWRFAGFDTSTISEEIDVDFAPAADGGVAITGFGGGADRTPVWLSGPVRVARTADSLVLVRGGAKETAGYRHLVARAIEAVRAVVAWRHPRLVVEVPADQSGLEQALGADSGSDSEVAAVTATVDGSGKSGVPVHVFVNPQVIGPLHDPGAQVVLSHEATHAATGAATNTHRPIWLNEGFADYVALRDTTLPLTTTAGQIAKQVRRHGVPTHLPTTADFDSTSDSFGAEYEAAWLACQEVADLAGQDALVALYDESGRGVPLAKALRRTTGLGVAEVVRAWQQRLSDLAS